MTIKAKSTLSLAAAMGTLALAATSTNAAVLLTTDFTGMTINGSDPNTADNISWTQTGLTVSSNSLTLENVVANQNDGELFDYASGVTATNGYFGGNTNLSRSPSDGQWGTTVTVTAGSGGTILENVVVNLTYASNSGANNNGNHTTRITATVFNDLNAQIGTITGPDFKPAPSTGGDSTLTFDTSPLTLDPNDTYTISFLVESETGVGHYAAFNALTFNGTVVPEPSTTALLGLGGMALILRRRK